MKKVDLTTILIFMALNLSSCTYNVSMAHTEGKATDVIDDNATNTPNISPDLNLPMTP